MGFFNDKLKQFLNGVGGVAERAQNFIDSPQQTRVDGLIPQFSPNGAAAGAFAKVLPAAARAVQNAFAPATSPLFNPMKAWKDEASARQAAAFTLNAPGAIATNYANIIGKGILDPMFDLGRNLQKGATGQQFTQYDQNKSPITKLGYQIAGKYVNPSLNQEYGINQNFQSKVGNIAGVAAPIFDAWALKSMANIRQGASVSKKLLINGIQGAKEGFGSGVFHGFEDNSNAKTWQDQLRGAAPTIAQNTIGGAVIGSVLPTALDVIKGAKKNATDYVNSQITKQIQSPTPNVRNDPLLKQYANAFYIDQYTEKELVDSVGRMQSGDLSNPQALGNLQAITAKYLPQLQNQAAPTQAQAWEYILSRKNGATPTNVPYFFKDLDNSLINTARRAIAGEALFNQEGYVRIPGKENIQARADKMIDDYVNTNLRKPEPALPGGIIKNTDGDVTGRYGRTPQAPQAKDYRNIAIDHLVKGNDELGVKPNKEFKDIMMNLKNKPIIPEGVNDPKTVDLTNFQKQTGRSILPEDVGLNSKNPKLVNDVVTAPRQGSRPAHQVDLENAVKNNDVLGVQRILNSIPDNSPYKKEMEGLFRNFQGNSTDISNKVGATGLKGSFRPEDFNVNKVLGDQTGKFDPQSPIGKQVIPDDEVLIQAKSKIVSQSKAQKGTLKEGWDSFYSNWVNKFQPIESLDDKVAKNGVKILSENSPKYSVKRLLGAGGTAELRHHQELKPILKQLTDNNIDRGDLDVFLKARRDIELSGRDVLGSDKAQAEQVISSLSKKYDTFKLDGIAKQLYNYQDKGLQSLKDAGFIDDAGYAAIKGKNESYVPFQRVMGEVDNFLGLPTNKAMQGTTPIKGIKGSERAIYSPTESIIANTYKLESAVAKNRVATSIAKMGEFLPNEIKKSTVDASVPKITVWEGGKKVYYEVPKDIESSVKGLNEESMNTVLKIMAAPAQVLRQGATGRNIDFMIPNVVKDQMDAAITSKYGYRPFIDYFSGLYHLVKYEKTGQDAIVEGWMKNGGKISFDAIGGRKAIQDEIADSGNKKAIQVLGGWLTSGLDAVGKYSEQPTRIGLYKRALDSTGDPLKAALESRDGTLDFARMGSKMKVANAITPFLNVGIQGFDKLLRSIGDDPKGVTARFSLYAGLPAIFTTVYNLMNHQEEYNRIPQYVKDSNFVIVTGKDEEGRPKYVTFPKGNIVPTVANPTENLINYLANEKKPEFKAFALNFLGGALPIFEGGDTFGDSLSRTVGSNLPQIFKPPAEAASNHSFFMNRDIVPEYLKNKPAAEQVKKSTPDAYKYAGSVLNLSPLQVQNFVDGTLGGYSKVPLNIYETAKSIANGERIDPNKIPVVRRFIAEGNTVAEDKKYEGYAKKDQKIEEKKAIATPPFLERLFGVKKSEAAEGSLDTEKIKVNEELKKEQITEFRDATSEGEKKAVAKKYKLDYDTEHYKEIDLLEKENKAKYVASQVNDPQEIQKLIKNTVLTSDLVSTMQDNGLDAAKAAELRQQIKDYGNRYDVPKSYLDTKFTGDPTIDKAIRAKQTSEISSLKGKLLEKYDEGKITAEQLKSATGLLNLKSKAIKSGGVSYKAKKTKTRKISLATNIQRSVKLPGLSTNIKALSFKGKPMRLKRIKIKNTL